MRKTMKVILLTLTFYCLSATAFSQIITLNLSNITVKEAIQTLREKTGYSFVYEANDIDTQRKISVKTTNKPIEEVVKQILIGQKVTYVIQGKSIVVSKNKKTTLETSFDKNQKSKKITGLVTDEKGEPIIGATVIVKDSKTGTVTDVNGKFSLEAPTNAQLIVTYVGYIQGSAIVNEKNVINFTLIEDTKSLNEVVVVGYGTQRKETLTGSVSSVKGEQLEKNVVANAANSLAGQLPGLVALQSSGVPGRDAATLSIRGFGNSLVIVDGIEAEIGSLDPNSIESVSILKDGASSIYGARAGNGVILVTTKRGKSMKPSISLNSTYTLQGFTNFPDKASSGQYTEMMSELAINQGTTVPYTPEQIQKYYDAADPYLFPNTDWEDVLFRKWAPQKQYNLSVRGGSDKIKYYGLVGYLNQETAIKKNGGDFSRIHLQSNIDAQITDQLSAQFDFSSINGISKMPQQNLGSTQEAAGLWSHYWSDLPIYPAELPDPTKYSYNGMNGNTNILSDRKNFGYNDNISNDVRGSLSLKYEFKYVKGLSAKAFVNARQVYSEFKYFQKPANYYTYEPTSDVYTLIGGFSDKALMSQTRNTDRVFTGQFSLNYDRIIKDHHVSGLLLYEAIDYSGNWLGGGRTNFLTPAIEQLFGGSTEGMNINGSAYEMGRKSIVARANYSYKNRYLVETSLRADASAKFAKESRWGYFPSVSLGWIMTQEDFMKGSRALEYLKLRASYGLSGNDAVGNFQYLSGYAYGNTNVFSSVQQGIASTGLANPNLTWENIAISNVGVDFSFWKRKMYGEADVFYRTRTGLIANRLTTLPSTFGANLPAENLNSTNDRGFEFKLGSAGELSDFRYDVSANVSYSRAKWDHFEEPIYDDPEQTRVYTRSGRWMDRAFGYVSEGLFTSQAEIDELTYDQDGQRNATLRPGDIRYKDVNGDGKIDWTDQVEIGKGNTPHWMYGLNFNLSYKNFDLSALFQGAAGYYTWTNLNFNSAQYYDNRWTEENNDPNAIIPRLGGAATNGWTSDHYYQTATYLRLKSINFGYNLPKKWLKTAGLAQCLIFVAGTNLLTWDKLKKFAMDPEAPSGGAGQYYPQQRTISCGIKITL